MPSLPPKILKEKIEESQKQAEDKESETDQITQKKQTLLLNPAKIPNPPSCTLYLQNLPHKENPKELKTTIFHAASAYGSVQSIFMCYNRRVAKLQGQAWVTFSTQKESESAQRGLNGMSLMGRKILAQFSKEKSDVAKRMQGEAVASKLGKRGRR